MIVSVFVGGGVVYFVLFSKENFNNITYIKFQRKCYNESFECTIVHIHCLKFV